MTYDFDTLDIFIRAFFVLAGLAAVLAFTGLAMLGRHPEHQPERHARVRGLRVESLAR